MKEKIKKLKDLAFVHYVALQFDYVPDANEIKLEHIENYAFELPDSWSEVINKKTGKSYGAIESEILNLVRNL